MSDFYKDKMEEYRQSPWMNAEARAEFDALPTHDHSKLQCARSYFEQNRWWWLITCAGMGMKETVLQAATHFGVDIYDTKAAAHHGKQGNEPMLMGMIWRMSLHQGYKKTLSPQTKSAHQLMLHLLDNGADPHVMVDHRTMTNGDAYYTSSLHCAVRSQFATDVLLARGVDPNIGTALDPHAKDPKFHQSVLYTWMEWATSCTSKERTELMSVLNTLIKAGVDANQPMRGWRRPNCQNNLLCALWDYFDMQRVIPDVLALGLDPHQAGANGLSFRDLLLAHANGKFVPMGWGNEQDGRISGKQKMRASNFLTWLDEHYPAPGVAAPTP